MYFFRLSLHTFDVITQACGDRFAGVIQILPVFVLGVALIESGYDSKIGFAAIFGRYVCAMQGVLLVIFSVHSTGGVFYAVHARLQ